MWISPKLLFTATSCRRRFSLASRAMLRAQHCLRSTYSSTNCTPAMFCHQLLICRNVHALNLGCYHVKCGSSFNHDKDGSLRLDMSVSKEKKFSTSTSQSQARQYARVPTYNLRCLPDVRSPLCIILYTFPWPPRVRWTTSSFKWYAWCECLSKSARPWIMCPRR